MDSLELILYDCSGDGEEWAPRDFMAQISS